MNETSSEAVLSLQALWEHSLEKWEDEAAHQALLEACDAQDALAFAAKRYRSLLSDPSRVDAAQKQLDKITVLAFSRIDAARSPPPNTKRGVTLAALAVSLFLIASSLYFASR